jgi:hypothetical protein
MDIVRLDTRELDAYIAAHTVNGEYLRYGPELRAALDPEQTDELDRMENSEIVSTVRRALAAFDAGCNSDTKLIDVKRLDQNQRERISSLVPANEWARGFREMFLMKILHYLITITNRSLPWDASESEVFKEKRFDLGEDGAWAHDVTTALIGAFHFLDQWHADPEPGSTLLRLIDSYSSTIKAMCQEAGCAVITEAELEEWAQHREERKKEKKKKWIIFGILFVIGFHLVRFLLGLFAKG